MSIDTSNFNFKIGNQNQTDDITPSRRFLQKVHQEEPGESSFGNMLKNAIGSVDEASKTADKQVEDVVSGKSENIHEVMISLQKAQLSFQLMLEIRNKAMETYQELSRMQL